MARDITQRMPIDIDAWLSSTAIAAMSCEEERAYLHLLFTAWKQPNCGLPDDDEMLARWSKLGYAKWKKSGPRIKKCFFSRDGNLYNAKQIFERERLEREQQAKSRGGSMRASVMHSSNASSATSTPTSSASVLLGGQLDVLLDPNVRTSLDTSSTTNNERTDVEDLHVIGRSLQAYMHGFWDKEPDEKIIRETIEAGCGASVIEINAYLCKLYDQQPPGSRRGPRSYGWFPVVVKAHFSRRRTQ